MRMEPSAWERAAAARARGEQPDPADLEAARAAGKARKEPLWLRRAAARITGEEPPEAEEKPKAMSEYEKKLRRRLGYPVPGDDPAA
jgi:hypothetical protein